MPNVILSTEKVIIIKKLLKTGSYTQDQIAKIFGVSRQQITRINVGINNPNAKTARWKHVDDTDMGIFNSSLRDMFMLLSNEEAGKLIKDILGDLI